MNLQRNLAKFIFKEEPFEPGYLKLFYNGELRERVIKGTTALINCHLCPRACGVDRLRNEKAVCKSGRYASVASFNPHFGEENPLRGWRGSGTIFFSGCNLRCVFCQNYDISQVSAGVELNAKQLAEVMLRLQDMGCHNINLVTPEHVVHQFLEALLLAVERGLRLPIVYNTSAYDSEFSLELLDGIVDIYMPDFKLWDSEKALKYLRARNYPEVARKAIKEMHRQVGVLKVDQKGIARRGLLVRHLVMPNDLAGTYAIMRYLAEEISQDTYVNIMDQYYPSGKVGKGKYTRINRRIRRQEYETAVQAAQNVGLWRFDNR